jgi:hypothetical protein
MGRGSIPRVGARETQEKEMTHHYLHTLCPHCGKDLEYANGEGMADSVFFCGRSDDFEFSTEVNGAWTEILIRSKSDPARICARWFHKQYGNVPPQTLTIGNDIFAGKNPRFVWFDPDLSDFTALIEKVRSLVSSSPSEKK